MKPRLVWLETHKDETRGILTTAEYGNESVLPFCPKRVFHIYDVPLQTVRGGHGHKECHQFMIAVSGIVMVKLGNGEEHMLDRPDFGLYVPPGNITWQIFLSKDACLVVLASEHYDPGDYIYPKGVKE
jgi:uncharacterized RmlC-like cupin family protein